MIRTTPRTKTRFVAALGVVLTLSALAAAPAEARRGGSFGSRGSRTYMAPRPTTTAPQQTAPIQRSMTPAPAASPQAARPAANPAGAAAQTNRRGGFLGGLGGGLLGGLVAGGLIGMLLGHGWGGFGAGFMNTLLQVAVIALAAGLLMSLFRRRNPAPAHAGQTAAYAGQGPSGGPRPFEAVGGYGAANRAAPAASPLEIPITAADRDAFEILLSEVQDAFSREDYAALRARTTPEVMSYLAEELSQNALQGRRNDVGSVRLLEADVAEAWREDDAEYATAALRYESIEVMRDRRSGAVIDGDPDRPTEATELWSFVRRPGESWKVSAIQDA